MKKTRDSLDRVCSFHAVGTCGEKLAERGTHRSAKSFGEMTETGWKKKKKKKVAPSCANCGNREGVRKGGGFNRAGASEWARILPIASYSVDRGRTTPGGLRRVGRWRSSALGPGSVHYIHMLTYPLNFRLD